MPASCSTGPLPLRTVACLVGWLTAVLLGATALPAAAGPEPERPPAASLPRPGIPQRYLDQPVDWQPCVFDSTIRRLAPTAPPTACATVVVPMDWLAPDAHPDIRVAISYSYATGTSRGLLTANPGGPGTPARSFPAALAVDRPELFASFDLLGMDPRGFGDSEHLTCTATAADLDALPAPGDPRRRSGPTHAAERAGADLLARSCSATELSAFVSTQQTAYDLDFVRVLLGYPALDLVGYGYGARLATTYAATYPEAAGAVIADSGPDWSTTLATRTAAATEVRRVQLFDWLARSHATVHLGRTRAAVERRYADLRAELAAGGYDARELDAALRQASSTDLGLRAAADLLRIYTRVARSGEVSLSDRDAETLRSVRARLALAEPGRLAAARTAARTAPAGISVDLGSVGDVVRCNDLSYGAPRTEWAAQDNRSADYPHWGYLDSDGMCAAWPHRAPARSLPPDGLPQVLIVSSAADPFAGLADAQAAHAHVPSSALVVVADTGQHDVAWSGVSGCADRIALDYLLTRVLPADTVCPGSPLPQELTVHPVGGPEPSGVPGQYRPSSAPVNPVLADLWADAAARS